MSPPPNKPSPYSLPGAELSLSGPALIEFLCAVLARGKLFRFQARGLSMHPFIKDGDVLTVSPHGYHPPRLGEVVAYRQPSTGKLVVHRVVARRFGRVLLQGDNIPVADGYIATGEVLGRVTQVARQGYQVRLGLGTGRALIALLARHGLLLPVLKRVCCLLGPWLQRHPI